jgi:hypothetical protein
MLYRLSGLRALGARLSAFFYARPRFAIVPDTRAFYASCKTLAFRSAADAGLDGTIEAFDGSKLHRAADGMCTIRMTLRDSQEDRSPAEAAAAILRSLAGLRVLLLLEIDECRFVNITPNANPGVRELGQNFTNRTGRTG